MTDRIRDARFLGYGIIVGLLMLSPPAFAELAGPTVSLKFDPVTQATGYKAYCSTVKGGPYVLVKDVGNITSADVPNCTPTGMEGTSYFVVTAYNAEKESAQSNEASRTWIAAAPNRPEITACPVAQTVYIVSTITGKTDRPLYSDSFVTIDRIEFKEPDGSAKRCEPAVIIKHGTTIKYHYATNNSGKRGLLICKEWP